MRGIRTVGVGLTIALTCQAGLAQTAPAARLGRIQEVQAGGEVRAQSPAPGGSPMSPMAPTPGSQPSTGLPPPRPLPNPTVTESRVPAGAPAATFGQAVPIGQPIAVGPPVVVSPPSVFPTGPVAAPAVAPDLDSPLFGGVFSGPLGTLTGPQKLQLDAEFLMWFVTGARVPALLTTSLPQFNGIIGNPTTRVLFQDEPFTSTLHTGGRFGAVYWFGNQQRWGLDGNIWFLARRGKDFVANSVTDPLLARPFINLNQGVSFSEIVAAPGLANGAVAINLETYLNGAEANVRRYLFSTPCCRFDMLAGFRYMGLNEELNVTEAFGRTPGSLAIGSPAVFGTVSDKFRTENAFYGAQAGLVGEVRRGRWFLEGRTTIAFGSVHQSVQISGIQSINFANGTAGVFPGGLLALPGANIGTFNQDKFAVLPEVGLKLGYHITPNLRVAFGYNFLYLTSVVRPGDQIDPGLDVTRIPNFPVPGAVPLNTPRPTVPFKDVGIFAQGISFSLQWSW